MGNSVPYKTQNKKWTDSGRTKYILVSSKLQPAQEPVIYFYVSKMYTNWIHKRGA